MKTRRGIPAIAAWLAALLLVLAVVPAAGVSPALAASPVIDDAQKLYDTAKFNDAATQLKDALSKGTVVGSDAVAARALLARCLVKAGNRLEAKREFVNVLNADPNYRPDAVIVPPDEMDVFNLALKDFQQEQIRAGQRIPASISFQFGTGSGDNKSLGEISKVYGGPNKLDTQMEVSGSVRFPLRPKLSLDIELTRLRSTAHDTTAAPNDIKFEAAAMPVVISAYYAVKSTSKMRGNVFLGAGPMLAASNSIDLPFFTVRIKLSDQKTGFYFHGGAEGEWLATPKVSLTGRVLYRSATASELFHNSTLQFTNTQYLKDRKVDFSGFGAFIGLRAYIGY